MGVSSLQASVNRLNNLSQIMYTANNNGFGIMEVRKPAPRNMLQQQQQQHWPPLRCPRCNSTNTKFCYYNNYSKTQPRYLCKACRRHWTEGGTLRDVPVGGGRKNKRVKVATDNQLISAAASTSNASEMLNTNNNNLAVQRLLNANPSSKVPDILRHMLLQPAQQVFPLQLQAPAHTISPDFGIMSGLLGPRDIVSNNLGPYNNVPNDTFSVSGYAAHTGTRGDTDTSMVPPVPVQLGTGNWSTWIEDISGLAANLDVKPPTNGGC